MVPWLTKSQVVKLLKSARVEEFWLEDDERLYFGTGQDAYFAFDGNNLVLTFPTTPFALRLPNMTTVQRDALTAAEGLIVMNTTTNQVEGYQGGVWGGVGGWYGSATSDLDMNAYNILDIGSGGLTPTASPLIINSDVLLDGATVRYIYGGNAAGDDIYILPNTIDAASGFWALGGAHSYVRAAAGANLYLEEGTTSYGILDKAQLLWTTTATATTAVLYNHNTVTSGIGVSLTAGALDTGDAFRITVDADIVTTGKALNIYGGSGGLTSVFSVNENGEVGVAAIRNSDMGGLPEITMGTTHMDLEIDVGGYIRFNTNSAPSAVYGAFIFASYSITNALPCLTVYQRDVDAISFEVLEDGQAIGTNREILKVIETPATGGSVVIGNPTNDHDLEVYGSITLAATTPNYIYGGDTTGDQLAIQANSVDSTPAITLLGAQYVLLTAGTDVLFNLGDAAGTYVFRVRDSGAVDQFTVTSDGDVELAGGLAIAGDTVVANRYSRTWTKIQEIDVAVDTTSVDITGLDLDTDKIYTLIFKVTNPTASDTAYNIYFNVDTVDTNYYTQRMRADTTSVVASRTNAPEIIYLFAGKSGFLDGKIMRDPQGYVRWKTNTNRADPASVVLQTFHGAWVTLANVTQIRITSAVASAIGAGSKVILMAMG